MIRCFRFALLLSLALLGTSTVHAARFRPPSIIDQLRAAGSYTVPEEWAGIWQSVDSTYTCTPRVFESTDTYLDTLCAGTSVEPDTTGGFLYDCTGTVTATTVNLTCTFSFTIEGCTASFVVQTTGTRSGDTAITTNRVTTTYSPPLCFFQPDSCTETVTRTTRIAPQPPACGTPTRKTSWGELKTRYH